VDGRRCIISEHTEQVRLFRIAGIWASQGIHPELELLFAIPNGGWRHKRTAGRLKAEGLKAGVPDTFLAVPRGAFAGLWIEMKYGRNTVTDNQQWWIEKLREQGYRVEICYSCQAALDVILEYLGGDDA